MASLADHSLSTQGLGTAGSARTTSTLHRVMLILFLLSATQPYSVLLGPILIGPYRLVLMILSVPLILGWVRGKYGGRILPDYLMLGHTLWISVALAANGQQDRIAEYGIAQIFDIFTAYLLGRAAIRSREDFYFFTKAFLGLLLFLVPFAFLEATQGKMILQNLFKGLPSIKLFNPVTLNYPERMGFMRAQTTINHPIVYGVFCSIGFSLGFVGLRGANGGTGLVKRAIWVIGSVGGTVLSFSAGALVSLMVQGMLVGWKWVMGKVVLHWQILAGLFGTLYIILQITAERPPLLVMARWIAFSGSTTWNRYLIWQFGTDEVGRHPLFGMGMFEDWIRAPWMSPSIDNHWLLVAMRFGLPGALMLLTAYFFILRKLAKTELKEREPETAAIRDAFIFMFIGIFLSLGTVVAWHVTYSLLLMLLGGSVWIFNEPRVITQDGNTAPTDPAQGQRRGPSRSRDGLKPVYTRFPKGGAAAPRSRNQGRKTSRKG
ncbi:O-antigen ligase family protein [Meridianimarinicoccus aquatilis]|uniref:O-antigen ligase domain-containing protein n=1 Tax=Meridianimarinicoccus aquatilis TaxID=2552766 RepID=A0A4R6AR73_9RHOB|nr:O-antigen ligase family protein [Fluviibacterium aquatile]QIE43983.1 O-antigen ligase family protein [Rhodobacteraceae bacterium SC52]TDL86397.1 hypothetical protein E2L05_13280 [Fluviibacterium aquatile]